jgi:hypothetical protein
MHDGRQPPGTDQEQDHDCSETDCLVGEELDSENRWPTPQRISQEQQDQQRRHGKNRRSAALPDVELP